MLGQSIYDVHMEGGSGSDGCMRTGRGSAPRGRLYSKLEPTDNILSSSHANKLAFSITNFEFRLLTEYKVHIFRQYKLVI